jgi:hypothetical protein
MEKQTMNNIHSLNGPHVNYVQERSSVYEKIMQEQHEQEYLLTHSTNNRNNQSTTRLPHSPTNPRHGKEAIEWRKEWRKRSQRAQQIAVKAVTAATERTNISEEVAASVASIFGNFDLRMERAHLKSSSTAPTPLLPKKKTVHVDKKKAAKPKPKPKPSSKQKAIPAKPKPSFKPGCTCQEKKFTPGWKVLTPKERISLEKDLFKFKQRIDTLTALTEDFVYDSSHWHEDSDYGNVIDYGKSVLEALKHPDYKDKHAPVLTLFRRIRSHEAWAVLTKVNLLATRVYNDVPEIIHGTPGIIKEVVGESLYQHVPAMFNGKSGNAVFQFTECPPDIQEVFQQAAALLESGFEPCGGGWQDLVVGVRNVVKHNQARYTHYLASKGFLIQKRFHDAVSSIVRDTCTCMPVFGIECSPRFHKKSLQYTGKVVMYKKTLDERYQWNSIEDTNTEKVPLPAERAVKDSVRCTIICIDHPSLRAAHAAILASPLFEGKVTKDRREEPTCRDVLQVVLFEGMLCEIQFHFKDVLPLKVFTRAAYKIRRTQDEDMSDFDTLFDFPIVQMEEQSREKYPVTCKLDF